MKKIPTVDDIKRLKFNDPLDIFSEPGKMSMNVFRDCCGFSYKFMKRRYEGKKRIFNHAEIDDLFFEIDSNYSKDDKIKEIIDNLCNNDFCWTIDNSGYIRKISDCKLCKALFSSS